MRIAIVKLSAMGDIVHAMVALQYLKRYDPLLKIDWLVEESFAPLLEYNPHVNTILPINLKRLKTEKTALFDEIKKVRSYAGNDYDLVIDAQGLLKSALAARLLGKNRAGFDRHSIREKGAAWLYNRHIAVPYETNVVERNLTLMLEAMDIPEKNIPVLSELETMAPFLFFSEEDRQRVECFLNTSLPAIVTIVGSSWESKVYPKEKFAEVIEMLEGNHLLAWGNEAEHDRALFIAEQTGAQVLPKLSLNELKAVIASADLVIGGDSGPTHMAWALKRPSITLFGPTPSFRNTVQTKINRALDCGKTIDPLQLDKTDRCIADIDPSEVVTLAKELLS